MFDLYGTDRLAKWKQFRDSLELSDNPFQDVAEFWSHAPFVSPYLHSITPAEWPDPWHLVLDSRLDELAIALGMLYTIKLTRRFMATKCEIHMSMFPDEKTPRYFLVVDNEYVLNLEYGDVASAEQLKSIKTSILWSN